MLTIWLALNRFLKKRVLLDRYKYISFSSWRFLNHQNLAALDLWKHTRSFQCAMFRRSRIVVRSSVVVLREILFCSFSSFFGFAACYGILVSNARLLALFLETRYTQSGQSRDEMQVVYERQVKNGNSGSKIFFINDDLMERQKREFFRPA